MKAFTVLTAATASATVSALSLKESVTATLAAKTASTTGALPLEIQQCTASGGCVTSTKYVTIDANWLWYTTDNTSPAGNCLSDSTGDWQCGDDCTKCELQTQPDYKGTYGITTDGNKLYLPYLSPLNKPGSRLYLIEGDTPDDKYTEFKMLDQEISFDVELSTLDCGFNAAVYFVEMASDGSKSTGAQGAGYGTGYCDAQCPGDAHQTITGSANVDSQRVCCNEMDLFEGNTQATVLTPHPCMSEGSDVVGPTICTGSDCDSSTTSGICDGSGCDFNSYRNGDKTFYGPGSAYDVDSTQTMTVTTQFETNHGDGVLANIAQIFTVNGVVIRRSSVTVGSGSFDSTTSDYCTQEAAAFNGTGTFDEAKGLSTMGASLDRGMVLALSLWNDPSKHMLWLDGTDPDSTGLGAVRGPCGTTDDSSNEAIAKAAGVTYSNIRWGDIDSTFDPTSTASPTTPTVPTTSSPSTAPAPAACANGIGAKCGSGDGGAITSTECCASGYVCCDNGATPFYYASCQTEDYCTSSTCEGDASRTVPCTVQL